jgi:hypothetical protein
MIELFLCADVHADIRVERQRSADAATGFTHKAQQLQQQLDQERSSKAAALLAQQEQFQQQKHHLQALLAEAEDQLERQRRELSAGFLLQAQQIEAKHAAVAADARAEAATAAALAETRAAEAAAAHAQAVERLKQAEVGQACHPGCQSAAHTGSLLVLLPRAAAAVLWQEWVHCVGASQHCVCCLCCRRHSCMLRKRKLP